MRKSVRGWLLLLGVVGMTLLGLGADVQAQGDGSPSLRITQVDTSKFPEVKLYLRGANLGAALAELPISVMEDGEQIETVGRDTEEVGTQTALVLDASGSILDPGLTGDARYIEVGNVARRLIGLGVLTQSDWVAAYAPQQSGEIAAIKDWTRDHQDVTNNLYIYAPPDNIELETPLYDLLFFVLDHMQSPEAPPHTAQAIVLFSDGLGGSSSLELNDAIDRAAARNIPIHTVLLGQPSEEGQRNMQRIATLTGGRALLLNGLDALDPLWQALVAERSQTVVHYRSTHARPDEVVVSATLPDGSAVRGATAMPTIPLRPPRVNVLEPSGDLQLTREAPKHDTPLEEIEPTAIDVRVEIGWPDDYPRELQRVEYQLHTETIVRDEPPFDQVSFPIAKLDSGRYTLHVSATDELGVEGRAEPVTFDVTVNRPLPPPPPPEVIDVLGLFTIRRDQASTLASLLALALGALAVLIAWRRPVVRERVADALTGAVKAVTEPFMINRDETLKSGAIKARLMVEDRGRALALPDRLELRGGITRIGRAPEYANLVLDDPRVSRYHCRITEDSMGNLCLYDEGGSSGTYVNYKPVGMEGYVLQSGDLINVGPVQLRFHYTDDMDGTETEVFRNMSDRDKTEPYSTQPPERLGGAGR